MSGDFGGDDRVQATPLGGRGGGGLSPALSSATAVGLAGITVLGGARALAAAAVKVLKDQLVDATIGKPGVNKPAVDKPGSDQEGGAK